MQGPGRVMAAKEAAGLWGLEEAELREVGHVDSGPCQTMQTGAGDAPSGYNTSWPRTL